ncbi:hypothetical protein FHS83_003580 [Rhizomicrobium palustre]|uniref:Uncharacterized protein n=1 Tax=Rhizomicrobium palustre TaxID=189966 RepID=A0A846N501_9PROT|nr:hypothetical protein [Rhizomicrobium palustre]NIK90262.1 hypothetical protein [Rhizomicrobium palustre]
MRKVEWIGAIVLVGVLGGAAALATTIDFGLHTNTVASDTGLPAYPGAKPHKDKDDESGVRLWGSVGAFGMKMAVSELDSDDQPARVAGFYRDALRKFGPVLDCSPGQPRPPKAAKNSDALDCGDDHAEAGGFVFKVGVKKNFHVVAVEPQGRGSKIGLVAVQMRGTD